jgi:mannose-6-phosphate isomerase-like protein (cupin superfamily)
MFKLSVGEALARLGGEDPTYAVLRDDGVSEIGLYRPGRADGQSPHSRDEVYVVAAGSGSFEEEGEMRPLAIGDLLHVKAGKRHRFVDFTEDFAVWVIFYG